MIGEISLGNLADRRRLAQLRRLPMALLARTEEVARLIEVEHLYGLGVGYVDVHLLASTKLHNGATLWTRDRRLQSILERMGLAARLTH